MTFPIITHLQQVVDAIAGSPEFIVVDKGDYTVVNYLMNTADTFPPVVDEASAIRRECRGLIFNKEGKLISRPYEKFFNVMEKPETQLDKIDFWVPHIILKKLDGSMIRPIPIGNSFRYATKMGITEIAMQAEEHALKNTGYNNLCQACIDHEYTPIFEWCSNQNRIVVDHAEDQLILIAIRSNITGEYCEYPFVKTLGKLNNIPVVESFPGNIESMQELMNHTRGLEGEEGYVVWFVDGLKVKVKGEWYLQLHKTKDQIKYEKDIIKLIMDERLDDLKQFLLPNDLERINRFEKAFWDGIKWSSSKLQYAYSKSCDAKSRKEFAQSIKQFTQKEFWPILFKIDDGHSLDVIIRNMIKKNLGSQSAVDSVRHLFGDINWKDFA